MHTPAMRMPPQFEKTGLSGWRRKLHDVIYESDTRLGRYFDIGLIATIILSTVTVMLDSEPAIRAKWHSELYLVEWIITILFTIEYALRLICIPHPLRYPLSFYGIVDLLAILPTYLSLFLPGAQYLQVIRILRILRIFRVLKLALYLNEGYIVLASLKASSRKIAVFLFAVVLLVTVFGSMMYVFEGETNGFTSIPAAVYWAIVTLTTVGYGDITPETTAGRFLASIIMILGYAIIAVPTGIVTAEMTRKSREEITAQACPSCLREHHDKDAEYCKYCGGHLHR